MVQTTGFLQIKKRFNIDMKNQITTVFVNPVPRISPQGRDKQVYSFIDPKSGELIVTQNMNKTREVGTGVVLSFKYNPVTHRLQTGLDQTIKNPFYQLEVNDIMETYSLSHVWHEVLSNVVKQAEIKLQTYYEVLDNVAPDFYTSEMKDGLTIFNMTKSTKAPDLPNFLQKFNIVLYDGPNRFSDDTPRGRLAIQLIKNHNKIAPNKVTVNSSVHDFYISEENEAAMEKSRKQDVINDAIFELVKLQREGSEFINYQLAILLKNKDGKPLLTGDTSFGEIKRKTNEFINDERYQMENIDEFFKVVNLLNKKEDRERFNIMYLVQQAINTNVMAVSDGYYIWHSKSGVPNMHKHINYDKLINLLVKEMKTWNPEDESTTNWYGDLYKEVKSKGIKVE